MLATLYLSNNYPKIGKKLTKGRKELGLPVAGPLLPDAGVIGFKCRPRGFASVSLCGKWAF